MKGPGTFFADVPGAHPENLLWSLWQRYQTEEDDLLKLLRSASHQSLTERQKHIPIVALKLEATKAEKEFSNFDAAAFAVGLLERVEDALRAR